MKTCLLTPLFAAVTILYGIIFPFLILFTNIAWAILWEPDDITAWMIVVTVYFLPMHIIPVIAWAWYSLMQNDPQKALVLLFTPAIVITCYIFTVPLIEETLLAIVGYR